MQVENYLYCLHDKVSGYRTHFMLAPNDGTYVREMIAHRVAFPLNFDDCEVECTGLMESDLFDSVRVVPWTAWRMKEDQAELLAPLGCSPEEVSEIIRNHAKSSEKDGKNE